MLIDSKHPLRPATAADVERLAAIYALAARTLGPQVYSAEQVAAWASFARDEAGFARYVLDAETWVAEGATATVLGFSGFSLHGDARDEAEIHSLYVHPEHGRRGIGRHLLAHVLRRASGAGATRFVAWATPFSRPVFEAAGMPLRETVSSSFAGALFERYRVAGDAASVSAVAAAAPGNLRR